jgi:3-oxoacyl-[acyl-carrier protein] reductase
MIIATGTNEKKLEELKNIDKKIIAKKFDLSKIKEIKNFVEESFKELGAIDILVNNAGTNIDKLSLRMSEEDWQKIIDINLSASFLMSKYTIQKMLKNNSGKIINITSIVGHTGNVGQSNYSASKAGIVGFTKSLAIEYARKNININCVAPGFISTKMTDKIQEDFKKKLIEKIPSGKLGSGEDVANSVAFLASDCSNYITGQTIHVNGGMYMS